jgi:3-phosphoshikimate 1-carboxyvinyltransferase
MENITIIPSNLSGTVKIPPSKSISHRAIICAALCEEPSIINNLIYSEDVDATINGLKSFGIGFEKNQNTLKVFKSINSKKINIIDCNESGSTLRFLIPLAAALNKKTTFKGRGKLVERPLNVYYNIFDNKNIKYENTNGGLPVTLWGGLKPGAFNIAGNISSQFITGLMFALPLLNGNSKISITTPLESKGYIDLTINVLKNFSVDIENNDYKEFIILGNQKYKSNNYTVEGDYSQAAFWLVANNLGNNINITGMPHSSSQGDSKILDIIETIKNRDSSIETKIDATQIPDLVPILAVLAALNKGKTTIYNAKRLRIKESDRLKAISEELGNLGANIKELDDGLYIEGKEFLSGGVVNSWNDHRIAMSLAIASTRCKENVILINKNCVNKSYPMFWDDFNSLGGIVI